MFCFIIKNAPEKFVETKGNCEFLKISNSSTVLFLNWLEISS